MEREIQTIVDSNPHAVGLAVVVSNDYKSLPRYINLEGTEKDGDAMKRSLEISKFAIVRKHNTSLTYLIGLLDTIGTKIRYPRSYRRIAFVFAGHGEQGGVLVTSEGRNITIDTVIRMLSPSAKNADVTQLGGMARLFFIDACRGSKDDLGILVTPRGGHTDDSVARGGKAVERLRLPSEPTNILVGYSTVSGYQSYEIEGEGGIWLQCLARKLVECDCSISDVLTKVRSELSEMWQDNPGLKIMNPETTDRLTEPINFFQEKDTCPPNDVAPSTITERQRVVSPLPVYLHPSMAAVSPHSNRCKPKIQLAPSFSNSPITPPVFSPTTIELVTTPHCQQTPSFQETPSIRIPVLSREVIHRSSPGHYRAKINECKMNGVIESYNFSSDQQNLSFRSKIVCKMTEGEVITGDSKLYYSGKKAISEEKAAEDALCKINKMQLPQCSHPSTFHEIPLNPNDKKYKGILNNLLFQKLKMEMPNYSSVQDHQGNFQCTISHSLLGKAVSGSKFQTKKEAENSAAWRALSLLKEHELHK